MRIVAGARTFVAAIDLDEGERHLLRTLFSDIAQLLTPQEDPEVDPLERALGGVEVERPEDPALLRLLPDADSTDPERSAEFRRYTEYDIRELKLSNARTALHTLDGTGRIKLDHAQTLAWLKALTDLRLVLAARMDVHTEEDFESLYAREDTLDDHEASMLTIYDFLTWAQERLTGVLSGDLDEDPEDRENPEDPEDGGAP
ncbi:DUF2017 domain-containing protein [Brevibacterium litoralis]|uniref:DUF2017 domain-containing protein n=1 Tax=Brevibacterium litoralis TaxID=3138935 RepID=UPI0032EFA059